METTLSFHPEIETYSRFPIRAESGKGIYLYDESGKEYIDLYGGHCVTILGHSPSSVVKAISEQAEKLIFYSNVVHSPIREQAATLLSQLGPFEQTRIFYCNSGSEANENAIKIAWKITGKHEIIALKGSFHGRTLTSIAATDSDKLHESLPKNRPIVHFVEAENHQEIAQLIKDRPIGALILEPIQSMNGVHTLSLDDLKFLRKITEENQVFLIFDEIQTGCGRTGTFSYAEGIGVLPDVITMAKSLASGIPIGAVLIPEKHAKFIKQGDLGTTFGGGMIAMAAHKATLEEIIKNNWMNHAQQLFDYSHKRATALGIEIRGKGCLIGLKLKSDAKEIRQKLLEKGFITGSSSQAEVIRLMPPINTPLSIFESFFNELETLLNTQK